jgi:hypothetical protein
MVGAKLVNMPLGGAIYRSENLPTDMISQSSAAEMLNISGRLVGHAKKVLTDGAPPPERNPAGHGRGEAGEYTLRNIRKESA